jgi:enoyl-CoA hydratase/carnithine racemase
MICTVDEGAVRLITMDRPDALNAFDAELYRGLASALDEARTDDSVHVVVLTGVGRAFSAGQDLKEMAKLAAGETTDAGFPDLLEAVQTFDKPLVAAVNGFAVGIGFTILPHCDLVLVAESARFRTPFAEMGVPPEAASSYLLPARMGWQRASYVLFTSAWLDAGQAVEYGIAFARHPDDALLPRALELATSIAAAPLVALRAIKRAMMAAQAPAIVAARAREDAAFAELLGGADTRAVLEAFNSPGKAASAGRADYTGQG